MKNKLAAGVMLALMALGNASAAQAVPDAGGNLAVTPPDAVPDARPPVCAAPNPIRKVAGGDPMANLRDAHKDPQRCKLSICIPASINLDVVCELTTARDSEGRYNCRMVINDFLRNCTTSCHTGDWSWLDNYRGSY